jgi:hypothetical protein
LPTASEAEEPLGRPGYGLPTFEAPPAEPPKDVRGKTDALMDKLDLEKRGVLTTQVVTRQATIQSIDPASRLVGLVDEHGVTLQKIAPPDVDLTQVKVGDQVTVKEIASVAVSVTPGAIAQPPGTPQTVEIEHAAPGEKPARLKVETDYLVATVAAIDMAVHTATLRNPDGSTRTILVDPQVDLDRFNVGDQVTLTLTKAVALSIDTPD